MQVVVVSHNQIQSIEPMLTALRNETVAYVLDRCTDGSNRIEFPSNCTKIINPIGEGFLAGFARDLGAKHFKEGGILFLDGDKVPQGDLNYLEEFITINSYDAVLLGSENDKRSWINESEGDYFYSQEIFDNPHNQFYSCGLYLSRRAINAVYELNEGRIFHSIFDGKWGEEDRFLGDQLVYLGMKIGYTSKIKLSGQLSDYTQRIDDLSFNFINRLKMRNSLKEKLANG